MRGLSPATIRNVMADLEDMGYLSQPHTSAGRVPTDKAYRFYVDTSARDAVGGGARSAPAGAGLPRRSGPAEQLMAETPVQLSAAHPHDGHPPRAAARAHRAGPHRTGRRSGDGRALAVVVTDTGWVTARPIRRRRAWHRRAARDRPRASTRRYRGKTFAGDPRRHGLARRSPRSALDARAGSLLDQIGGALPRAHALPERGHSTCSTTRTSPTWPRCGGCCSAFEDKARLIDLLSRMAQERGVQVMIGSENPLEEMRECSLIASTYTLSRPGARGARRGRAPAHGLLGRDLHGGRDGPARVELAVARPPRALPAVAEPSRGRPRAGPSAILGPSCLSDSDSRIASDDSRPRRTAADGRATGADRWDSGVGGAGGATGLGGQRPAEAEATPRPATCGRWRSSTTPGSARPASARS